MTTTSDISDPTYDICHRCFDDYDKNECEYCNVYADECPNIRCSECDIARRLCEQCITDNANLDSDNVNVLLCHVCDIRKQAYIKRRNHRRYVELRDNTVHTCKTCGFEYLFKSRTDHYAVCDTLQQYIPTKKISISAADLRTDNVAFQDELRQKAFAIKHKHLHTELVNMLNARRRFISDECDDYSNEYFKVSEFGI
jgi:hypothetical protein